MSQGTAQRQTITPVLIVIGGLLATMVICVCCCAVMTAAGAWVVTTQLRPTPQPPPSQADFRSLPPGGLAQSLVRQIEDTPTTDTDYWLIHGWLVGPAGRPAVRGPVRADSPDYQVGDVHTFWMGDEQTQRYWQVDAELRIKTDHAYIYVTQGTSVNADKLRQAADLFESKIYSNNRRYFGSEWMPGIDNDPHMTILVTDQMPIGIAGYFSSADEYPRQMKGYSNEREMIYVTQSYLNNLDQFGQLLSHEFQHMIHWNQDLSETLWINEGLSLMAEEINGYPDVLGGWQLWNDPDIQLTNWSEDPNDRLRNYAASKLFLSYLGEHYGGYELFGRLAADKSDGVDSINNLLRAGGHSARFTDVFADWVAANVIQNAQVDNGRYDYALCRSGQPRLTTTMNKSGEWASWVSQFGADYIEILPSAGRRVIFQGSEAVRLTDTSPRGSLAWWSNRRNMLSSSLTRQVDLRSVSKATLRFATWYDIESDFDYAYVAVSTDQGRTWKTLPGTYTTSNDPNKANLGHAYTGKSGGWLNEQVDLSAFAGQVILLRFWYISDPGLNQSGWLVDDISIPEIGWADNAETLDAGWTVDGFIRSSNEVPQHYVVQWVEFGAQTTVRRITLDAHNRAELELGDQVKRAVLIVSGATLWTSEAAPYRIEVK